MYAVKTRCEAKFKVFLQVAIVSDRIKCVNALYEYTEMSALSTSEFVTLRWRDKSCHWFITTAIYSAHWWLWWCDAPSRCSCSSAGSDAERLYLGVSVSLFSVSISTPEVLCSRADRMWRHPHVSRHPQTRTDWPDVAVTWILNSYNTMYDVYQQQNKHHPFRVLLYFDFFTLIDIILTFIDI